MLILASFVTTNFGYLRARWHGMPIAVQVVGGDGSVDLTRQGAIALFDTSDGRCIWNLPLESPAGFALIDDSIYIASMLGHRVYVLDFKLDMQDSFGSRLMNDLHSLWKDGENIVIASSGTDAILQYSLDGKPKWTWFASEHGYASSPFEATGNIRSNIDYRLIGSVPTAHQATHINSAVPSRIRGRAVSLCTLFHQGELIAIDRETGHASVLMRGMNKPHSPRRISTGWSVCSSGDSIVVILDEEFSIRGLLEQDFNWVQDAIEIDDASMLIADANNNRFVLWNFVTGRCSDVVRYPSEWKVYQFEQISGAAAMRLAQANVGKCIGDGL